LGLDLIEQGGLVLQKVVWG